MTSKGKIIANVASALVGLRQDDGLKDAVAYDEMLHLPVLQHSIGAALDVFKPPVPLRDEHVVRITEYLQRLGLPGLSVHVVSSAVDLRASERVFQPLQSYLRSLVWDEQPRVNVWLTTRLGVERSDYSREVGRMFLIAMVARAMQPGCKCDHMMVLEGPQGTEKSRACAVLGSPYFSDHLPDIRTKDSQQLLRGKWLIEVSEMHVFGKVEAAHLKAYISRDTERYRPSHGRKEVIEPQSCVFVGTTNKTAYLRDETGGRRFWPVVTGAIGAIDIDGLIEDRDQLFAEALRLYDAREPWWPDPVFERETIAPEQENRYEADAWEEYIGDYLRTLQATGVSKVLVGDIAKGALSFDASRLSNADQRRITACLGRLGWRLKRQNDGRFWVPNDAFDNPELPLARDSGDSSDSSY
jgi:predicted P-loop ATPase